MHSHGYTIRIAPRVVKCLHPADLTKFVNSYFRVEPIFRYSICSRLQVEARSWHHKMGVSFEKTDGAVALPDHNVSGSFHGEGHGTTVAGALVRDKRA
jgi:hypothetical protein